MYLHALPVAASPQSRHALGSLPHASQPPVRRAVLQPGRVEAVIQRADRASTPARARARRCVVHDVPAAAAGDRARAVHRRIDPHPVQLAAAHLKPTVTHCALDQQSSRLDDERLHEEDARQRASRRRSACHLEVARSRKDDTALHRVVGDYAMERTGGGRAEGVAVARGGQAALHEGVWRVAPPEGAPLVRKRWLRGIRCDGTRRRVAAQHRVRDRAAVPEGAGSSNFAASV